LHWHHKYASDDYGVRFRNLRRGQSYGKSELRLKVVEYRHLFSLKLLMFSRGKVALLVTATSLLGGCGGRGKPVPTSLDVQTFPSDGVAYVSQTPPWNQVSFTAYLHYDDGHIDTNPVADVQWVTDPQDYWVILNGNVGTCFQASPSRALVHATAQVNGVTLEGLGTMWCD
jgi:hypothetical protein